MEIEEMLGDEAKRIYENALEFLQENPEYLDVLLKILQQEGIDDEEKSIWDWQDIHVHQSKINKMITAGIVDDLKVGYGLSNHEAVKKAVRKYGEKLEQKEEEEYKIPDNLFDPIVGYNDIKERFERALKTNSVTQSILLVGPRASAKTLFLSEISGKIKGVRWLGGSATTEAGFEDRVMEKPNFLIIDQFDEAGDIYGTLLNYQDRRQPYSVTKSGKNAEIGPQEKAPIFASANETRYISEENLDRFWIYEFEKYGLSEYKEVCKRLLPREYDIPEDIAITIAKELKESKEDASVRLAERIAEVCDTRDEVHEEIRVLEEYS